MFTDVIDMVSVLLSTIQLMDLSGTSAQSGDAQRYWHIAKRLLVFDLVFYILLEDYLNATGLAVNSPSKRIGLSKTDTNITLNLLVFFAWN